MIVSAYSDLEDEPKGQSMSRVRHKTAQLYGHVAQLEEATDRRQPERSEVITCIDDH